MRIGEGVKSRWVVEVEGVATGDGSGRRSEGGRRGGGCTERMQVLEMKVA